MDITQGTFYNLRNICALVHLYQFSFHPLAPFSKER